MDLKGRDISRPWTGGRRACLHAQFRDCGPEL